MVAVDAGGAPPGAGAGVRAGGGAGHAGGGAGARGPQAPAWRARLRQRLARLRRPALLGALRRARPLSDHWGYDRGTPVDRYYIERFLAAHAADVRGRALEVMNADYVRRFGGARVTRADVLDIDAANPNATVVADLAAADAVPGGQFDCFVLTQTLQLVYDVHAAVRHAHRLLAPGGVLLATVPVVSRIATGAAPDYWRLTAPACERLFGDAFGAGRVEVRAHGNVLAAVAFLAGAACEELPRGALDADDPDFPLLVTVRARKD